MICGTKLVLSYQLVLDLRNRLKIKHGINPIFRISKRFFCRFESLNSKDLFASLVISLKSLFLVFRDNEDLRIAWELDHNLCM